MKFGVNAWVWTSPVTTEEVEKLAPHVRAMGFDILEIPLETIGDVDYPRGAQIIRDAGLEVTTVAAMGPDRDLIHPDAAIRTNGVEYIRQGVVAAQQIGATNFVGPLYSAVGRTWEQTPAEREKDLDLLVKTLRELAEFAGDHGVVLGVEALNRFETSFINLTSQTIEVVDRVNHPACRVMADTFHMNIEERSLGDALRAAGPRLCQVHTCENDRGAPGSGHLPWNDVAQALKDIHFTGPLVIESFTPKVKSIARAAAIWRQFAPSSDALAQDGLTFLKQLFA